MKIQARTVRMKGEPMPIDYALDRPSRLLRLTAHGDVSLDELLAALVRRACEGAWPSSILCDVRQCRCSLTVAEVSLLTTRTRNLSVTHGVPGVMAIVTSEIAHDTWTNLSRSLVADVRQEIAVFSDAGSADDWLAARTTLSDTGRA